MGTWDQIPPDEVIAKTAANLRTSGIEVIISPNASDGMTQVLKLLPEGATVFAMTSVTSIDIGLTKEIDESGKYQSVRKKLLSMNRDTQKKEMKAIGSVPDYVVGSVHAVTEDGQILIASKTGSQLAAYVYGADHVIWVVGCQKIVANLDTGLKRIYEYCLPLENTRSLKAYGVDSAVNKILIINREFVPGRIKIIFIKQNLGF